MKDWIESYRPVRQRTVRSQMTREKAGAQPPALYNKPRKVPDWDFHFPEDSAATSAARHVLFPTHFTPPYSLSLLVFILFHLLRQGLHQGHQIVHLLLQGLHQGHQIVHLLLQGLTKAIRLYVCTAVPTPSVSCIPIMFDNSVLEKQIHDEFESESDDGGRADDDELTVRPICVTHSGRAVPAFARMDLRWKPKKFQ